MERLLEKWKNELKGIGCIMGMSDDEQVEYIRLNKCIKDLENYIKSGVVNEKFDKDKLKQRIKL